MKFFLNKIISSNCFVFVVVVLFKEKYILLKAA